MYDQNFRGRMRYKTIMEDLDLEAELDEIDDNSGDENLYRELIVNNAYTIENTLSQMEE